jgi:GH25 family lysozyme M1 (1,4-beta-N-acetylmuramidase)
MSDYYKIDYALLAKSVSAVMIRGGQGIWVDDQFQKHYDGCVKNGIPFGIWWFCQPDMKAQYQIDAFMKLWNSLAVKPMVIAYDVEEIDYIDANGTYQKLFPPSRQFSHDNTLLFCKEVKRLTGGKVGIYTRKGYFEAWTFETDEWYQFWMWIAAWYNYTGTVPPVLPWKWPTYLLHQYEGGGLGTPGVDPINTCKEYFNGTLQECLDFFGGKEPTPTMPAQIHNTKIPLEDRAWVMEIKGDQKPQVAVDAFGVDALILPMVGMPWDGNHSKAIVEPTFSGRYADAHAVSIPVFGKIELDAGIVTTEQHTQPELDGHSVWQNLVVPRIIDAWHIGPWTPETLKVGDFRQVSALIFEQVTTQDHQTPRRDIESFWQAYFFRYVVDKLKVLIDAGAVPNVPIILKTTPEWVQKYVDFTTMLNYAPRKTWLYMALTVQMLGSTSVYNDLWSIYQFANWDTFKWPYVPDGYQDRVLLFEFTTGKQKLKDITDAAGVPTPVSLSKWCDTAQAMKDFLGAVVVIPPVDPPPSTELADKVTALELKVQLLDERLSFVEGKITKAVQAAVEAIKIITE